MKRFITVGCTLISLGITAVAFLSTRLSGTLWLELISPFQVQYFVVMVGLSAIALCLQKPRLLLLTLFCTALLSASIAPWYVPSLAGSGPANYRVISANLNVANSEAANALKWAEKENPDLALFMEVNDTMAAQLEALKATMPYSSNQAYPYQPGSVLYSKYPLTHAKIQTFNTNNAVNLTATVQREGQQISVVAIHPLPPMKLSFLESRNAVFSAVSDYTKTQTNPVLLIGDFNVTMWSPHYQELTEQTGLKNARKGFGTLPTWPVNASRYLPSQISFLAPLMQIPIDHCLVSQSLAVTDTRIGDNVGSDHLPIVIDLSILKRESA